MSGPSIPQHGTDILIYPPGKLTCPLKINGWKIYFLLKSSLFRGHVSFRGCIFPKDKFIHHIFIVRSFHTWTLWTLWVGQDPMGIYQKILAGKVWAKRMGPGGMLILENIRDVDGRNPAAVIYYG